MSKSAKPGSPFDAKAPRLFSIDAGRPFLADLAHGLIDALGDDLPFAEIFFPTRRAVRTAADAILKAYEERGRSAALLPRFRAIGDIDEDELIAFLGADEEELSLPPAVSATERMVTLARLVARCDQAFAGHENWPAAIGAARELGKLIDAFHTEEIEFSALNALKVDDIAGHWENSLKFLEIVTAMWPLHLREINRMDPAERRAKLIDIAARRIREKPPAHPLVIAGTTASAPAVARLVSAVSFAPKGLVVLPGLDHALDARAWEEIGRDDAHPQSGLKELLDKMRLAPADVLPWPKSGAPSPRARLLTLALRPSEATDDWLRLVEETSAADKGLVNATRGLSLVEADNEEMEASIVAAIFRETLETPGATAALVTPDRHLSRRVALKMRRWNVLVDDSAGVPFANTRCGTFLRLVALFLEDGGDPVSILALLRHPLSGALLHGAEKGRAADRIDRKLRGTRPAKGLLTLKEFFLNEKDADSLEIVEALSTAASGFADAARNSFAELLDAHLRAAEIIAGEKALWSGDDGEKGATLVAELRMHADEVSAVDGGRYSDIFSALIAGAAVRGRRDAHPRLSILGPLEARMQSADRIILGGLNEGVWPQDAPTDAFLSRRMRKEIGLPSPERRVGLSAHDFAGLAAQPEIVLTRSSRAGGKPANPSRWIVRLKNILSGGGALEMVDRSADWRSIAEKLDAPAAVTPAGRPRPRAGRDRRPQKMSVTRIEKWLRDPYSIYAIYLLGLRKLEDPGAEFGPREMGSLLHKVFEKAALSELLPTPQSLAALYDDAAPDFGLEESERRFWSVAVEESFNWFCAFDAERRQKGAIRIAEEAGEWTLEGVDPPFTLTAVADRIDLLNDGRAAIFDYKSGRLRTEKQDSTFSPQLALTGAIVAAGGYSSIGAREVASYAYIKTLGRSDEEKSNNCGREEEDARTAINEAETYLRRLVAQYDSPDAVYQSQPRPEFLDDYGDYDQLARRKEWGSSEDGESE